jgi:hypothetical protein
MRFLSSLGKAARSAGRTIGSIGAGIRSVADSGVARTVASAVGTAGKALLPLAMASAPEFAPALGVVGKALNGLQNGSVLNKVSSVGGTVSNVGRTVSKFGNLGL